MKTIYLMTKAFIAITSIMFFMSCSEKQDVIEVPGGSINSSTSIFITKDWGISPTEVKSKQKGGLSLMQSTEHKLKYTDKNKSVTIDYVFENNKLIGASLTNLESSTFDDIKNKWLKDYTQLSISNNDFLFVSKDHSTLAYGKILNGNEGDYTSIAWTYMDENETNEDKPDFSPSGQENGIDYVDLGLGIGWAVQNVGASSPGQSGGYYMWAETSTGWYYYWTDYSLYKGSSTGYRDDDKFYTPYSNIAGTNYDVARKKLGGQWRMPTRTELESLMNNCELITGTYDGVKGIIATGPSGKSVFFPAAGYKEYYDLELSSVVYLWSSTSYGSSYAYSLWAATANSNRKVYSVGKWYGMPVRGVVSLK